MLSAIAGDLYLEESMLLKTGGSVLVLAFVLGCAGQPTTSGSLTPSPSVAPLTLASVAGEYKLVSVDGRALPMALRTGASPIISGSLLLNANGTFRVQTAFGPETSPGNAATGTCYTEANEVKMVWDGGGMTNMTLRGDTLVLKREGALYGYLRGR